MVPCRPRITPTTAMNPNTAPRPASVRSKGGAELPWDHLPPVNIGFPWRRVLALVLFVVVALSWDACTFQKRNPLSPAISRQARDWRNTPPFYDVTNASLPSLTCIESRTNSTIDEWIVLATQLVKRQQHLPKSSNIAQRMKAHQDDSSRTAQYMNNFHRATIQSLLEDKQRIEAAEADLLRYETLTRFESPTRILCVNAVLRILQGVHSVSAFIYDAAQSLLVSSRNAVQDSMHDRGYTMPQSYDYTLIRVHTAYRCVHSIVTYLSDAVQSSLVSRLKGIQDMIHEEGYFMRPHGALYAHLGTMYHIVRPYLPSELPMPIPYPPCSHSTPPKDVMVSLLNSLCETKQDFGETWTRGGGHVVHLRNNLRQVTETHEVMREEWIHKLYSMATCMRVWWRGACSAYTYAKYARAPYYKEMGQVLTGAESAIQSLEQDENVYTALLPTIAGVEETICDWATKMKAGDIEVTLNDITTELSRPFQVGSLESTAIEWPIRERRCIGYEHDKQKKGCEAGNSDDSGAAGHALTVKMCPPSGYTTDSSQKMQFSPLPFLLLPAATCQPLSNMSQPIAGFNPDDYELKDILEAYGLPPFPDLPPLARVNETLETRPSKLNDPEEARQVPGQPGYWEGYARSAHTLAIQYAKQAQDLQNELAKLKSEAAEHDSVQEMAALVQLLFREDEDIEDEADEQNSGENAPDDEHVTTHASGKRAMNTTPRTYRALAELRNQQVKNAVEATQLADKTMEVLRARDTDVTKVNNELLTEKSSMTAEQENLRTLVRNLSSEMVYLKQALWGLCAMFLNTRELCTGLLAAFLDVVVAYAPQVTISEPLLRDYANLQRVWSLEQGQSSKFLSRHAPRIVSVCKEALLVRNRRLSPPMTDEDIDNAIRLDFEPLDVFAEEREDTEQLLTQKRLYKTVCQAVSETPLGEEKVVLRTLAKRYKRMHVDGAPVALGAHPTPAKA
ncbi:hypothetical protein FB567DRAFT_633791 [Paraphoma chrysanthemicola]|uniref:Uncharacterized protein n=1 Tax=Paraphoma chrysanthemicola TaxID=798071 RepID=A0A8K0QV67_9PLEO|nr:hypothetical protein FB567DRAFT_633791 [Paraphoma chrysanthemicola]